MEPYFFSDPFVFFSLAAIELLFGIWLVAYAIDEFGE